MLGGLALAFLVVTLVEAWLFVEVGGAIGFVPTFLMVLAVSAVGAWLVKREGLGVWRRAREQVGSGRLPGRELADGALILFGGALLFTPGFITDVVGLALLFPLTRSVARKGLLAVLARRAQRAVSRGGARLTGSIDLDDLDDLGKPGRKGRPRR